MGLRRAGDTLHLRLVSEEIFCPLLLVVLIGALRLVVEWPACPRARVVVPRPGGETGFPVRIFMIEVDLFRRTALLIDGARCLPTSASLSIDIQLGTYARILTDILLVLASRHR